MVFHAESYNSVSGKLTVLKYDIYWWVYFVKHPFTLLETCNIVKILREFLSISIHFSWIHDPYLCSETLSLPSVFLHSAIYNHRKIFTNIASKNTELEMTESDMNAIDGTSSIY
jgi:hypothetical protein